MLAKLSTHSYYNRQFQTHQHEQHKEPKTEAAKFNHHLFICSYTEREIDRQTDVAVVVLHSIVNNITY